MSVEDAGQPCSRVPAELCDGARLVIASDGTTRREAARTPRSFCEPCRSRVVACLEELPAAYQRLAAALGDAPRTGKVVKVPFGPSEPIRAAIDALIRETATILHGWEARVRKVARLDRRDTPGILDPESVEKAAGTLAAQIDVLLALQPGWMSRTFTFPPGKPGSTPAQEGSCRRCGHRIARLIGVSRPDGSPSKWYVTQADAPVAPCAHVPQEITSSRALALMPADLETEIGDEEILAMGDGWVQVTRHVGAPDAGNEIIALHYRARCALGETRTQPEFFDGIPCRACDEMALERAEPPSDPSLAAMHSRCALCKDEMDRAEFAQWAERYASWARGAGIQVCRRCSLAVRADTPEKYAQMHAECCWIACSCGEAAHPRRPMAA